MSPDPSVLSSALCQSIIDGPVLIGDLPEAEVFPHRELPLPADPPPLNLRQKLGHLYEDAFALLIEVSPRFDLLERNLQIQVDRHRTLGELDFLLRDHQSGSLVHVELATKFYLAVSGGNGISLPGPDPHDDYFSKLASLRTHQLTFASCHRDHLPAAYREEPVIARQLVTGCLFDHPDASVRGVPEFIHPDARRGGWLRLDDLGRHFPADAHFELIPKALWPVPLAALEKQRLEPWSPDAAPANRCVMLRVDKDPKPWFVTPNGYPGI